MAIITTAERTAIVELYVATFNRAPDATGLAYWIGRYEAGMKLTEIARSFFDQPETKAIYGVLAADEVVTKVYNNVLGRAPDEAGKAYWTNELVTGKVAKSDLILAVINAAKSSTGSAADAAILANKAEVGTYYAVTLGGNDTTVAKTIMAGVTSDTATVTVAKASADGSGGKTFTLTAGADAITGTSGNDTITGAVGTLTSSDEIVGGAGNDTLIVKIDNLTANNTAYAPIIGGVETITLEARNASANFLMTNVSGATTVNVKGITNFAVSDVVNSGSVTVTDGYSANLTLDIATNTATAQAFTVNFNNASGTDVIISEDSGTTAQDVLTLNAVTNWGHGTSMSFSGMEKLALKGDGSVSLNFVSANGGIEATGYGDLTAIDASGLTGALTVSIDSKDINLVGGAGNDTITLSADLSTNDTINGGAGADVLNATLTGGYVRPIISNVETLNVLATNTAVTADFRDIAGVTTLNLLQGSGVVLDKLGTSVSTLTINSSDSTANALTIQYGTGAAASDVTLNLGNGVQGNQQSAAATASGMGIGTITFSGNSGSLNVITNSTAKYSAAALELKDFASVTLNAASANLAVDGAVDLYTAQTLSLVAGAGRTLSIGDDLSGDSVRTFTINAGQSATVTLAETANIDGSAGTVSLSVGASGLIDMSAITFCGADTVSLNVGASALITANSVFLGQEGATAGSGALAANSLNLSGAGDVAIAALVGNTGATSVQLAFNINPTSTAADVGISGITFTEVADAATASEQDVAFNISGVGNVTLSAATTVSSNITYRVNATALASGSNLVINLANINDTDSVASAVFGAASGSYVGVDGVDNIELGLGAMTVNGGLGNDVITLGNTAAHRVEIFGAASALAGLDTIIGAGAGDVVLFAGAGSATATTAVVGSADLSTGTATNSAQILTASYTSIQSGTVASAIDRVAIYTSNGDTILEVLLVTGDNTTAFAGLSAATAGDQFARVVLSNKDFTAITAAFQLNTTGSGLSITLL